MRSWCLRARWPVGTISLPARLGTKEPLPAEGAPPLKPVAVPTRTTARSMRASRSRAYQSQLYVGWRTEKVRRSAPSLESGRKTEHGQRAGQESRGVHKPSPPVVLVNILRCSCRERTVRSPSVRSHRSGASRSPPTANNPASPLWADNGANNEIHGLAAHAYERLRPVTIQWTGGPVEDKACSVHAFPRTQFLFSDIFCLPLPHHQSEDVLRRLRSSSPSSE